MRFTWSTSLATPARQKNHIVSHQGVQVRENVRRTAEGRSDANADVTSPLIARNLQIYVSDTVRVPDMY